MNDFMKGPKPDPNYESPAETQRVPGRPSPAEAAARAMGIPALTPLEKYLTDLAGTEVRFSRDMTASFGLDLTVKDLEGALQASSTYLCFGRENDRSISEEGNRLLYTTTQVLRFRVKDCIVDGHPVWGGIRVLDANKERVYIFVEASRDKVEEVLDAS